MRRETPSHRVRTRFRRWARCGIVLAGLAKEIFAAPIAFARHATPTAHGGNGRLREIMRAVGPARAFVDGADVLAAHRGSAQVNPGGLPFAQMLRAQ